MTAKSDKRLCILHKYRSKRTRRVYGRVVYSKMTQANQRRIRDKGRFVKTKHLDLESHIQPTDPFQNESQSTDGTLHAFLEMFLQ
mmetsp:Transcript_17852/g.39008  ORF Transcript_17852/g.39008 Transcript_17852/m.39008 type:complete len:85 (-) Transcript_17852:99-353(-)